MLVMLGKEDGKEGWEDVGLWGKGCAGCTPPNGSSTKLKHRLNLNHAAEQLLYQSQAQQQTLDSSRLQLNPPPPLPPMR